MEVLEEVSFLSVSIAIPAVPVAHKSPRDTWGGRALSCNGLQLLFLNPISLCGLRTHVVPKEQRPLGHVPLYRQIPSRGPNMHRQRLTSGACIRFICTDNLQYRWRRVSADGNGVLPRFL